MGQAIHWESGKKFKFDNTLNPESVLENETHKIRWDFEIQTAHLISAVRPDQVIVNEKKKKKRKEKKEEPAVRLQEK